MGALVRLLTPFSPPLAGIHRGTCQGRAMCMARCTLRPAASAWQGVAKGALPSVLFFPVFHPLG